MEFPASFIPKKTIEESPIRRSSADFFTVVSTIVFLVSVLGLVGTILAEKYYKNNISKLDVTIQREDKAFDEKAIAELDSLSKRLAIVNDLLSKGHHPLVSRIFILLENDTLKNVYYSTFSYKLDEINGVRRVVLKLDGQARDYASIAMQSEIFRASPFIIDHSFSGLENGKGGIVFSLVILVNPDIFKYEEVSEDSISFNYAGQAKLKL